MKYIWHYKTPIGRLGIAETEGAISHVLFDGDSRLSDYERNETAIIKTMATQLLEYFDGKRISFDCPLFLRGTEFQKSVWSALQTIPFGETRSYKDIAEQVGNPKAVRAVGMANNRNRLPIIIPCHRVVGSNGKLVGYAGGLDVKQYLLDLEKSSARGSLF